MADNAPSDANVKTDSPATDHKEDEETRATREELKQSRIDDSAARPTTPSADVSDAKDEILSPKKKRAHDQLDETQGADDNDAKSTKSDDSAKDRSSRLEPEKKRPRDQESAEDTTKPAETRTEKSPEKKQPQTSSSAFASSGFGKMATTSSPFASLQGSSGSAFGSAGTPSLSSFASPKPSTTAKPAESTGPKLTFGGSGSASPFAGLSSGQNGFGSSLGGKTGFGAAAGGAKPLGSFAAPGIKPLGGGKSAKPFGAPDSDAESEGDDEEGDDDKQPDEERAASPEKESEEKKKTKLQKVEVNDGETGEATILSVRAKVFHLDKEAGWKERGSGMLKINVPNACVEFDDNTGAPIPGSFDASGLELDEDEEKDDSKGHKVARLILRQDQTHRVILNTAILPAMEFQEKSSLKSVAILFTAFEGDEAKPVNITVRMTAANAKSFMNEIGSVKRELQSN